MIESVDVVPQNRKRPEHNLEIYNGRPATDKFALKISGQVSERHSPRPYVRKLAVQQRRQ